MNNLNLFSLPPEFKMRTATLFTIVVLIFAFASAIIPRIDLVMPTHQRMNNQRILQGKFLEYIQQKPNPQEFENRSCLEQTILYDGKKFMRCLFARIKNQKLKKS